LEKTLRSLAYENRYNIDDYQQWKGDWELIGGHAYAMAPSPLYNHQLVNLKIARQLDEKLDHCQQCHAIFEIDLEISDDTIVRPDSMVICYEPTDKLTKTPEIVFEVISKNTAKKDEILKFDIYQSEAIPYYVLIYPHNKKAKVYKLIHFKYQKIGDFSTETLTFETKHCKIEFDFGLIWKLKNI
jgi:Uma2 family endonuclease